MINPVFSAQNSLNRLKTVVFSVLHSEMSNFQDLSGKNQIFQIKMSKNFHFLRRHCYGIVRCVEVDKKCSKRFIPDFIQSMQHVDSEKVIENVYKVLLTLPIMLKSRWDMLTLLASSRMITHLDDILFKEVKLTGNREKTRKNSQNRPKIAQNCLFDAKIGIFG
ncbi:hypothetical protein CRE_15778 [Caenorhabditis remanei]|uniref:Uncharacterized protein n=1 Tax=Caenorhabditis remanei TaxID=31234 RepID=E3NM86_CAERE|nr:hypothetical protein CRE_15778 [Caenorhabditis remanei]